MGDRTTEKGQGGGDLVETFELHEITPLPTFHAPKSSDRNLLHMHPGCLATLSAP